MRRVAVPSPVTARTARCANTMFALKTLVVVAITLFVMYIAFKLCTILDIFGAKSVVRTHSAAQAASGASCPLCGTRLLQGQQLHSRIFGSVKESTEGQRCNVMGCPSCYPKLQDANIKRCCPVCKKPVAQDGYLISRLFTKTKDGKPHVIVTGCINCGRT